MNIRTKLLLILLAFSLTPLIAVTIISQQGTRRLGKTVSEDSFKNLTEITSKALEQTASISARAILQSKTGLEYALLVLAAQAEQALTSPYQDPSKIFMAWQFDDPAAAPPDLVISSAYLTKTKAGGATYQKISFNHPVFITAPGVPGQHAAGAISRLARLTESFKTLSIKFGDSLHWASVSLENGIHVSYPGHGGYSNDYDPRKLAWYKQSTDTVSWTFPTIDPVSGQVTFTVSKRLYYPDGSFAGAASLDILIANILAEKQLSSLWSADMRAFMVAAKRDLTTREAGLVILAQKKDQDNESTWSEGLQREWLLSPETGKSKEIVGQMEITTSGNMELPYNGVDSLWAYAYIEKNSYFVIIVPKSVIMGLPEKQSRSVLKYTKEQLGITAVTAMLAVVLLSLAALFGSKTITRSVRAILSATRRLANGDFSVRINMTTRDELQELFNAFNDMVPRIENNFRVQKALNLAMEVQQNLLPKTDPEIEGLDIAGTSIFCEEIGGDYYDYLTFEQDLNHRTGIVIGDVSDHGIPSALLMATARSSLRQRISQPGSIADIVHDLNRQLARDVEASGRFMTLFFLTIDLKKNALEWVRAGHDPAIFYDPAADSFQELRGPGLALGVKEDWAYAASKKEGLAKGQIIVLGTDGIWEARNQLGDMFKKEPVLRAVRENAHQSAKSILTAIIDALTDFLKPPGSESEDGAALFKAEDDITLVVVKIGDTPP